MSIFDKIKDAFDPVGKAVQNFNPEHAAQAILEAIEKPIKNKIPNHLSLGEAAEIIKIAEPSAIDIDVFAGFGVEIGVELELEFGMGITISNPIEKVTSIVGLVQHPPETVHQLCDLLWGVAPSEVRIYERLQAVVGEQATVRWDGQQVMERVTKYIGHKGWLEKRLRP